ncbi:MAG: ApaG domain, partial [Phycisphaerales bacterium]|nr:ApaG domain [Phycisphaerales bacterium]
MQAEGRKLKPRAWIARRLAGANLRAGPMQRHHSKSTTRGIEITAQPRYLAQHSDPSRHRYAFGYDIRIENRSPVQVQLLS